MQNNDQSVDPNLVKLADAFDIASTKLKEASVHPADDACSPALLAVEIGEHFPTCLVCLPEMHLHNLMLWHALDQH